MMNEEIQKDKKFNPALWIEICNREWKFNNLLYDQFRPDYRDVAITSKFYARHEAMVLALAPKEYMDYLTRILVTLPPDKYQYPLTENQRYGWYRQPLIRQDRGNRMFYAPHIMAPEIKIDIQIKEGLKRQPKDKYVKPDN